MLDIRYEVPVRGDPGGARGLGALADVSHLRRRPQTLEVRVRRLETDFAWAEQPPSRTRHYVTNVLVDATDEPDRVPGALQLLHLPQPRGQPGAEPLLALPQGHSPCDWQTAGGSPRRWAAFDQSLINAHNLSIFI